MKAICVLTLALMFSFNDELRAQTRLTDVFPLAKGLRYTYNYKSSSSRWYEVTGLSFSSSDSGIVTYQVIDSSRINDTTIAWTIRESRAVLVRARVFPFLRDTTYFLFDSSLIQLREFTTGRHELRGSAHAWQFPRSSQCPVYRYSDTSNARVFYTLIGCHQMVIVSNHDSLWMSADSGLTKREYSVCYENNGDGSINRRSSRLLTRILVAVKERLDSPPKFALSQNYPNPFNPTTRIEYAIPKTSHVSLKVFDLLGREVATLVDEVQGSGIKSVEFDAGGLTSGIYFYRLHTNDYVATKKLMVIR